jgi:hypothetical protein
LELPKNRKENDDEDVFVDEFTFARAGTEFASVEQFSPEINEDNETLCEGGDELEDAAADDSSVSRQPASE